MSVLQGEGGGTDFQQINGSAVPLGRLYFASAAFLTILMLVSAGGRAQRERAGQPYRNTGIVMFSIIIIPHQVQQCGPRSRAWVNYYMLGLAVVAVIFVVIALWILEMATTVSDDASDWQVCN